MPTEPLQKMTCEHCGHANPVTSSYCEACGSALPAFDELEAPTIQATNGPGADRDWLDNSETIQLDGPSGLLADRYRLLTELGRGGMGVVWQAHDTHLDMQVAIKLLPEPVKEDPRAIARLKAEARAAMRLSHPNIVHLYQFEECERGPFLVMELLSGPSLAQVLSRRMAQNLGPFPIETAAAWAGEALEALAYAHSSGVIHRDIKPHNLLLSRSTDTNGRTQEVLKLTDFGIAHLVSDTMTRLTRGGIVGTPAYMSPEQLLGNDTDIPSDIYSVGVMLYEFLTGEPPFSSGDITYQHLHTAPKPLQGEAARLNPVVMKALQKRPEDRWQSAGEFRTALESAATRKTPQPPPKQPPTGIPIPDTPVPPLPKRPRTKPFGSLLRPTKLKWIIILAVVLLGRKQIWNQLDSLPFVRTVVHNLESNFGQPNAADPRRSNWPATDGAGWPEPAQQSAQTESVPATPAEEQQPQREIGEPPTTAEIERLNRLRSSQLVPKESETTITPRTNGEPVGIESESLRSTLLNRSWRENATGKERAAVIDSSRSRLIKRMRRGRR